MKIVISKKLLLEVLVDVEKCVSTTCIIPITGGVLINADKDAITVVSTDTEKGMRVRCECTVEDKGVAVIPFKKLMGVVRELSSQNDISISTSEVRATITSGHSKFNISLLPSDEFPKIDFDCKGGTEIIVKESDIKKISQYVSVTTGKDPSMNVLAGINFVAKNGKVKTSSTDRRRLSEFICDYKGGEFTSSVVVPVETFMSISGIIADGDGEVKVSTNYNTIFFHKGDKVVCSRLIVGEFPDYSSKLPKNKHIITFSHSDLVSAVKQVTPFVTQDKFCIKIHAKKEKAIVSIKNESGDAEVTIPIHQVGGDEIVVGFNSDYLSSFLRVVKGSTVLMEVSDEKGGVVCKTENEGGYLSLIMPLVG